MKKILFSVCIAALAIGCSKTEISYGPEQQIAFAPVAKNATKAAIEGTAFNTIQDLYVFANAGVDVDNPADGVQIDECTEAYLRNAKFTRARGDDAYTGETPHYWPNVKSLIFAGYVDAGDAKTKTTVNAAMTTMTVTDYVQPDSGNNDLMYFFTAGSFNKEITGDVPPTMLHSCAWLSFNFKGDAVSGNNTTPWKVEEVTVKQIAKTGTATLTAAGASWAEGAQDADFVVYDNAEGTALTNGTANATIAANKDVIVIPQATTNLYVKYSYTAQAGNKITEEKTVPLAFNGAAEWAAGTKYTYTVTIGAKEISIKPDAADWEAGTGTGLNQTI